MRERGSARRSDCRTLSVSFLGILSLPGAAPVFLWTDGARAEPLQSCSGHPSRPSGNGRIIREGDAVKSRVKDQVTGAFHEAKGMIKEIAGKIANQPDLEVAGETEKNAGKLQVKGGRTKKTSGK
jgi:uncharacterized protein YjbJ (UPF0337 family)